MIFSFLSSSKLTRERKSISFCFLELSRYFLIYKQKSDAIFIFSTVVNSSTLLNLSRISLLLIASLSSYRELNFPKSSSKYF